MFEESTRSSSVASQHQRRATAFGIRFVSSARALRSMLVGIVTTYVILATHGHADAAALRIATPERAARMSRAADVIVVGTAEAAAGVGAIDVAVRNLASRDWLRRDGSWGARQFHRATLLDGGATTADWSFAFAPPANGRYLVIARGSDRAGATLGARASHRFRVVAPEAAPPVVGDLGEFVASCPASHRLRDDPIVFPGMAGHSHLHSFFGSTVTDAFATLDTLLGGGTTCDPVTDRSAYWVPTLVENGVALEPEQATFYYLTANDEPGSLRPFPPGLRILAGTPSRTGPDGPSRYKWSCRGADASSTGDFAVCPAGHELELLLNFPDCWNGRDLDAPDHKAHMAYGTGGDCPARHPVAVPQLQFKLRYPTSGGPGVRIATGSGVHASHGGSGYSAHGDFFNAWEPGELEARIEDCLWRELKCDASGVPE